MNRIAKWDNAKFILIILVVICHFYENYLGSSKLVNSLFFSVYTFHMPAFFLISGMFSKKTVNERKIVKVVPYLLVYLFMKMFGYLVSRIMNGGTFVSIDFFQEAGAAWFIMALFFMYLITFYTRRFRPAYVMLVSILISMAAGYSNVDTNLFSWLRIVVFYPFFYAGYALSMETITKWTENKKLKMVSVAVIIVYFIVCYIGIDKLFWARFLLTGRSYEALTHGACYGGILRLFTYMVSFALVFAFLCMIPKGKNIFSHLGTRTLGVYVFHYNFINLFVHSCLYKALYHNFPNTWEIMLVLLGIAVTLICCLKPFDTCCRAILSNKWKLRPDDELK